VAGLFLTVLGGGGDSGLSGELRELRESEGSAFAKSRVRQGAGDARPPLLSEKTGGNEEDEDPCPCACHGTGADLLERPFQEKALKGLGFIFKIAGKKSKMNSKMNNGSTAKL
jgi:hypothetical protein